MKTFTFLTSCLHYNTELHHSALFSTVPQSVFIEDELIDPVLSVIRCSPLMHSIRSFEFEHDVALRVPINHETLFFAQSSYLNDDPSHYIFCPNLKQLTITIYHNIISSQERVLPVLQHLSSVEHLTLLLAIDVTQSDHFIDRFDLQRNIVSYMPHSHQFHFHIRSILRNAPYTEIDTIHQSFIEKQQSVDCALDYFDNHYDQCQIYSLPFIGNHLDFISNRFPLFDIKNTFINVHIVTQTLPSLRTLEISNQLEQEEKKTTTNPIEFSHLYTLILRKIHMDYGEQLLCRAHLPHLVELVIRNDILLTIIDQDNQQAKNNCSNVETLFIVKPWIEPTSVHLKFFPKICTKFII